jgi:2-amino-4-hydroxy-6-hydroxymethyldihydropteridine diphosphokinase
MIQVVLLLGGNEGDVESSLAAARERIGELVGPLAAVSSLHRTAPWGTFAAPQQEFLNQALIVETTLAPEELLDATQQIERELGRRVPAGFRRKPALFSIKRPRIYHSRPIDIDILFYDDLVMRTPRLTIPHPLVQEREFALAPLAEIASDLRHPVLKLTVSEMLRRLREGRTPL